MIEGFAAHVGRGNPAGEFQRLEFGIGVVVGGQTQDASEPAAGAERLVEVRGNRRIGWLPPLLKVLEIALAVLGELGESAIRQAPFHAKTAQLGCEARCGLGHRRSWWRVEAWPAASPANSTVSEVG